MHNSLRFIQKSSISLGPTEKQKLSGSCISIVSHHYSPKSPYTFTNWDNTAARERTEFDKETEKIRTGQAKSSHCFLCMQTQRQLESLSFTRPESSPSWKVLIWLPKQKHDPDSTISVRRQKQKRKEHNNTKWKMQNTPLRVRLCSTVSSVLPLRNYLSYLMWELDEAPVAPMQTHIHKQNNTLESDESCWEQTDGKG